MKYGVLMHKSTMNLGDDIQSYASARFLPHIDYVVDRENLDKFESEGNEPVGVIMSAWWMWQKWNWPPAECIVPKLLSMHMNNYTIRRNASPVKDEWLQGIGGEYFRANGPVGCRDQTTLDFFNERNIECYFSGCITLTLPKQKKTEDAGTYVCLVDLKPSLEKKAKEMLKDTGLEVRVMTHRCDYRKSDATMEERFKIVEDTLTQYQNAKMVITRRLHVGLPCLALGTPVLCLVNMNDQGNITRWAPYYEWVNKIGEDDFIAGNFEYDFNNPKDNPTDFVSTRESLIRSIQQFIDETKDVEAPIEDIKKVSFTEKEAREWQFELMRGTLDKWLHQNRGLLAELKKYKAECGALEKRLKAENGGALPEDMERIRELEKQLKECKKNVTMKDLLRSYKRKLIK